MEPRTDDLRINKSQPLVSPAVLAEELPLPEGSAQFVQQARQTIENILSGKDDRVLAIVGPCSVHDPEALLDFARQFKAGTDNLNDAIYPVLRVYFEKPRTTVGWKGLINDPDLNNTFQINKGLRLARSGDALGWIRVAFGNPNPDRARVRPLALHPRSGARA